MLMLFFIITLTPRYSMNGIVDDEISLHDVEEHIQLKLKQKNIDKYKDFTYKLGFLESRNRYHVISASGSYMGKYQFGYLALSDIDMAHYPRDDFIYSEYLQEIALFKKLKRNEIYLSSHIKYYEGKVLSNGVKITKSGILAGAHLLGAYTVKKYISNNGRVEYYDGNGTALSTYIKEFSNMKFELNKTIKKYIEENYDDPRNI